jgi:GT2 family glycosyltransferase
MSVLTEGLFDATDYADFELIVVDNGSTDPDTLALYEGLRRGNFTLDIAPAPFNFSAQVNRGVALAKGEAILLLNNDIEVIEPGWLAEMVGCLAYADAGIVGARLLYPSGDLQHAGVAVGLGGLAGHWYLRRPADFPGPMGRLSVRSAMTAVTGACMLVTRACFEAAGPFDEANFAVAYNDVDFCLRARAAGFRTIYTPFATLVHHESASRGRDDRGPNRARFLRDQAALLERHGTGDFLDPVLSPWRDRIHSEPGRVALDALPRAR